MRARYVIGIGVGLSSVAVVAVALTIPTQSVGNGRTGEYQSGSLDVTNVKFGAFAKLFEYGVDGLVYAQPLYVENVAVQGVGTRNVVFIATDRGELTAWDANSATLFWRANISSPVINDNDDNAFAYSTGGRRCHFHHMNGGIVGTPVIDTATNTIYVVSWQDVGGGPPSSRSFAHMLAAFDIRSGVLLRSAIIGGTAPGSGGTTITFNSFMQFQRPGLLLANGNVYIGFGSIDDRMPSQGWVFAYRASDLVRVGIFCTTCAAQTPASPSCPLPLASSGHLGPGGIWQAGAALAADPNGNIYVLTGNGPAVPSPAATTVYGQSAVKLSASLTVLGRYTPPNADSLSDGDLDFGSTGILHIPAAGGAPEALIAGSKVGRVHVITPSNMSLANSLAVTVDQSQAGGSSHIHGSPVFWAENRKLFVWGERDHLVRLNLSNSNVLTLDLRATFLPPAPLHSPNIDVYPDTMPGGQLVLSRNTFSGNAIVWAMVRSHWYSDRGDLSPSHSKCSGTLDERRCAKDTLGPGFLRAIDGSTMKQLWYSERSFTMPKFAFPSISNGKVYVPTFDRKVLVFGACSNCAKNPTARMDYDADNRSDFAIWRPSVGGNYYYFQPSETASNTFDRMRTWEFRIGDVGDIPVPGDYDGDGKADICIWRSSNHTFYYLPSSLENGATGSNPLLAPNVNPNYNVAPIAIVVAQSASGDIPVPGDFDGDGASDFVLRRDNNHTFYYRLSRNGTESTFSFGDPGDVPISADYDGDGITDFALRRSTNFKFYVFQSSTQTTVDFALGNPTDVPIPGDYDGDNKADYALWRPSTHQFFVRSSSNGGLTTIDFGMTNDIATPGDYNGDGNMDLGLRRTSDGTFRWRTMAAPNENVFGPWGNNNDVPIAQLIANPANPNIVGR
jgi:hypothetical protein